MVWLSLPTNIQTILISYCLLLMLYSGTILLNNAQFLNPIHQRFDMTPSRYTASGMHPSTCGWSGWFFRKLSSLHLNWSTVPFNILTSSDSKLKKKLLRCLNDCLFIVLVKSNLAVIVGISTIFPSLTNALSFQFIPRCGTKLFTDFQMYQILYHSVLLSIDDNLNTSRCLQ